MAKLQLADKSGGDPVKKDFGPYCNGENAVALLSAYMDSDGFDRKTMYHLEIIKLLIDNEKEIFERVPSEVLRGLRQGGEANAAASFIARADEGTVREAGDRAGEKAITDPSPFAKWDRQEAHLEQWARAEGCWYQDIREYAENTYGEEIAHGNEARVFDASDGYVVKMLSTPFDLQDTLDRISINNFLFSDTTEMQLIGMGRDREGMFCFLIRQPFIQGKHVKQGSYDIEALSSFEPVPGGPKGSHEYSTKNYLIGDLHDRNVIVTPEGNLAVIDCNLFLNTPELGKGGEWVIPDVIYDKEDVVEMNRLLDSLLPRNMETDRFLALCGNDAEQYRERMQNNKFFSTVLDIRTKDGRIRKVLFQKDPMNRRNILWNFCDNVAKMVRHNRTITESQKENIISRGMTSKDGRDITYFDLNRGRIMTRKDIPLNKTIRQTTI